MNTDQLVQFLSADVPAVPRGALMRRLGAGILAGALVTLIPVLGVLGARPDLGEALGGFAWWMKLAYTGSLGIGALLAVGQLARPYPFALTRLWPLAIPVILLAGISVVELVGTNRADWRAMWLGESWVVCPWIVLILALPIFIGLLWSFRRLAPTRTRAAGAAAGLASGAWAALIYSVHCPEASALFVLTWYNLGILLATGLGAWLGPRFMRW